MTKLLNHAFYLLGVAMMLWDEFGHQILPMVPDKWRHWITIGIAVLMYAKSHRNLFQNPDGSPAQVGYQPPK